MARLIGGITLRQVGPRSASPEPPQNAVQGLHLLMRVIPNLPVPDLLPDLILFRHRTISIGAISILREKADFRQLPVENNAKVKSENFLDFCNERVHNSQSKNGKPQN
jgi:hypothetical protein